MLHIINRMDNSFTYFEERAAEMTATVWWWTCCFLLWCSTEPSDVSKDWTYKNKDKDQAYKDKDWSYKDKDLTHRDQDKDKDFTYSYLLQVAAKPTIAIKQQQWTQSESSQHMTVQEAQLMLATCAMRLAVSRGQQTWYHFGSVATFR